MKNVLIYVEKFLPPSQSFVINQASAFRRYRPEILAGHRVPSVHSYDTKIPVHEISRSTTMRVGELMLKVPHIGLPILFPIVGKADIVHAHFGKNGYLMGPLARAAARPLVTTFHGFDATYEGNPRTPGGFNQVRFFSRGRREMAGWNCWNIAVSEFIRNRLQSLGFPESRIYRHYIGIDLSLFTATAQIRKRGLVVSIARFVEYKGHKFMIEALSRVAAQGVDIDFVMVGQGPLRNEIEAFARRALPNVTVHENMTQPQIRDLLAEAEVYLHGSVTLENGHAEAFGLANLEAQAVGTPVVAFRSGGVGEAVEDRSTGFLLEERDVTGMADAVGKLLTDHFLWQTFSARAKVMVAERFDISHQTLTLEDYYDSVCNEYTSGAIT